MLMRLGETSAERLLVSPQVLDEIEQVLRRKAPRALGTLALLLDQSRTEIVSAPTTRGKKEVSVFLKHDGDAAILASAVKAGCDFFVTLDRQHFLANPKLAKAVAFPLGTPGDCLSWYRARLQSQLTEP